MPNPLWKTPAAGVTPTAKWADPPSVAPYRYPFGGFGRILDLQQVPFIGAYMIFDPIQTDSGSGLGDAVPAPASPSIPASFYVLECNAITTDSAFADDGDRNTDPAADDDQQRSREQLGRMYPLRPSDITGDSAGGDTAATPSTLTQDTAINAQRAATYGDSGHCPPAAWRYRWATMLPEYFTVGPSPDDYFPNIGLSRFAERIGTLDASAGIHTDGIGAELPTKISNLLSDVTKAADRGLFPSRPPDKVNGEDVMAVQGMININTAPARVLSMLPMLPDPANNFALAKAIVRWRDGNAINSAGPSAGAFTSVFDLYNVPEFRYWQNQLIQNQAASADVARARGDYSFDVERYDWEKQSSLLSRIANNITTRSDTFTVYVQLQGWQNVGTSSPKLVAQRRTAFVVDRSGVGPGAGATPVIINQTKHGPLVPSE